MDFTNVFQRNPGFPCNQGQKMVTNNQSRHFDFQGVLPAFNKNDYGIWIPEKNLKRLPFLPLDSFWIDNLF